MAMYYWIQISEPLEESIHTERLCWIVDLCGQEPGSKWDLTQRYTGDLDTTTMQHNWYGFNNEENALLFKLTYGGTSTDKDKLYKAGFDKGLKRKSSTTKNRL